MASPYLDYLSKARSIFPNYCIYQIRDSRLEEEKEKLNNLSPPFQFLYGAKTAIMMNLVMLTLKETVSKMVSKFDSELGDLCSCKPYVASFKGDIFYPILLLPIVEEIFFRGLLQNGICHFQEQIKRKNPDYKLKSQISTSPTTAVILSSIFFSVYHARWNITIPLIFKKSLSIQYPGNYTQALSILYSIPYGVLHYTTGNRIWAPLGFHIGHNAAIFGILNSILKYPVTLPSLSGAAQYTTAIFTRAIVTTIITGSLLVAALTITRLFLRSQSPHP